MAGTPAGRHATVGVVLARAANGVIGRDNTIPWRLPEDQAHFRELTRGATVIMGRRTWDSLPARFRPLPGRRNLVLTRSAGWSADGAEPYASLEAALAAADGDVWVMGGVSVYREALTRADVAVITELREPADGDTYAPEPGGDWTLADLDPPDGWHESRTGLHYRIRTLRRG